MKKVAVLMSTYNGENYLKEQVDSLITQVGVDVSITVRDDGSSDKTIEMLDGWQREGVLTYYVGPNLKPGRSFMDLIMVAPQADYYAFCDQDDVWDSDKLVVAITRLEEMSEINKPVIYFSRTRLVDRNLVPISVRQRIHKPGLGAALMINPVTGCTEVFNSTLLSLLRRYKNENVYMHDGWSYRVCMAMGGGGFF